MCGRFALYATADTIKKAVNALWVPEGTPRYNIAPSQDVLVLIHTPDGRRGELMQWGLVPFFAPDKHLSPPLINARAESVHEKPSFRRALQARRCLVPMSGFFEWQRTEVKQPYYITSKTQEVLLVAGLWEQWISKKGESLYSCCLLTTAANAWMSSLHHRMPVILNIEQCAVWLSNQQLNPDVLRAMTQPYPGALQRVAVTQKMNNWRFIDKSAVTSLDENG